MLDLHAIITVCQVSVLTWHGRDGVTNLFQTGSKVSYTGRNSFSVLAGEARDPVIVIFLNSMLSDCLLNICVFTCKPRLISALVRETSFAVDSSQFRDL